MLSKRNRTNSLLFGTGDLPLPANMPTVWRKGRVREGTWRVWRLLIRSIGSGKMALVRLLRRLRSCRVCNQGVTKLVYVEPVILGNMLCNSGTFSLF